MALDDPNDPLLAAQLYGSATPAPAAWSWIPDHWAPPAGGAPLQIGPVDAPLASGVPTSAPVAPLPELAAAPTPAAEPQPIGDVASAGGDPDVFPPPAVLGPPAPAPLDGTIFDVATAAPQSAPQLPPPEIHPADLAAAPAPILPSGPPVLGPPAPTRVADLGDFDTHIETNAEKYETHPWDNPVDEERAAAARHLALTDPVKFERYANDLAASKEARRAAQQARADRESAERAKADADAQARALAAAQAKSAAIDADAQALQARTKDRGRWFRNLSTFGKISAVIGAVSGALMSRPGGPNLGVDFITKHIDDDIADQASDIENARASIADRRGAVAQEFARTGDLFRAQEAVRQASYQDALAQLQTMQQNFDPNGTSFVRVGREVQAMQARINANAEAVRKTAFEEGYKVEQLRQTSAVNAETRRHNQAQESAEWRRLSLEADKNNADKTVWTPEQLKVLNPNQAIPAIPMTMKAYGQWLETQKTGEEHKNASLRNNPDERNRELAVGGVVDDKGAPVRFRSTEVAGHVAQGKEDAEEIVRLTDELIGMVKKNGWKSDYWKSPEWRKATANYNTLIMHKKEQDKLGVLSGSDVELVKGEIGTDNPTEARSPIAGLEQFRHNVVEGFNAKVRAQAVLPDGRKIVRWDPVAPPTEAAVADKLSGKTFAATVDESDPGWIKKNFDVRALAPEGAEGVARAAAQSADRTARVGPTGLALEDDAKVVAAVKAASASTGAERAAALDRLVTWASSNRSDISNGVLGRIQAENPQIYATVRAQLPEGMRDERKETDDIRDAIGELAPPVQLPPPPPSTKRKGW